VRKPDLNTVLIVLAIGVAWYLYRKTSQALTPAINVAADAWFALTAPPAAQVRGQVKLPDGSYVSLQEIAQGSGVNREGFFTWRGSPYQITGREDSVYIAKRLVT
jgi:hypothetical protein